MADEEQKAKEKAAEEAKAEADQAQAKADQAKAKAGQAKTDADQARAAADKAKADAEGQPDQAKEKAAKEAKDNADQAKAEADQAQKKADQAKAKADDAKAEADQSKAKVKAAEPKSEWERILGNVEDIVTILFKLALAVIAIYFIYIIASKINEGEDFLTNLRDPAVVRGFITFIIAFATIAIALILVMAAFYVDEPAGEKTNLKDRFDMGKGVLTALIGILGTIVGFYFGSIQATPPAATVLKVADAKVSSNAPKQGETIKLSFQVTGGKAPYLYTVTFPAQTTIAPLKDKTSEDGKVSENIVVPDTTAPNTELTPIKIEVTDSDKKTAPPLEMKEPKIVVKGK
jgi:hypothetical protein